MTEDLAARMAETAALIEAHLAKDESIANALDGEAWGTGVDIGEYNIGVVLDRGGSQVASTGIEGLQDGEVKALHIARHDPARVLRRVKATRELVAAILAERHDYVPGDEFYSCSQAVDPHPGESGEPGSGCSDPERAGKPCDCGRDQRVARLLGIIAGEWREDGHGG